MRKGFINILAVGVVGAVILVSSVLFTKHETNKVSEKLGASVATTSLTDGMNQFRLNVNSSTEAINTQLEALSSTVTGISTTLTLVPISKGGTGTSTTPGAEAFLVGNGSSYDLRTFVASSGLTLTTTTTNWTLSTQGLDLGANYVWTGRNEFSSTTIITATGTLNASGTVNLSTTTIQGTLTLPSSTPTGVNTATRKDYVDRLSFFNSTGTLSTVAGVASGVSIRSISIPPMGANDVLEVNFEFFAGTASTSLGTTTSTTFFKVANNNTHAPFTAYIINRGATNSNTVQVLYREASTISFLTTQSFTSSIETGNGFTLNLFCYTGSGNCTSEYMFAKLHRANN